MGKVDAGKLQSTATHFSLADPDGPVGEAMRAILDRHYGGVPCPRSMAMLA